MNGIKRKTYSLLQLDLASVNKGKQRRPAAAKPHLLRSRPRLAAASLRPVALQTRPCGAGAVLWSFGAMPGPLARQTTTPSLPEGEEDNAGRGPRHCPQNRCCPCSPMLKYLDQKRAALSRAAFDADIAALRAQDRPRHCQADSDAVLRCIFTLVKPLE